jgi:hypothetical protein
MGASAGRPIGMAKLRALMAEGAESKRLPAG